MHYLSLPKETQQQIGMFRFDVIGILAKNNAANMDNLNEPRFPKKSLIRNEPA
jgi:hypothetical protein